MIASQPSAQLGFAASGLRNPCAPDERIRALLFDLDGTLYRQSPMRALMAVELITLTFKSPIRAPRCWRGLKEYRRAQETLRAGATTSSTMAVDQFALASARAGLPVVELERLVAEWMLERPLKYLRYCRPKGLEALLDFLDRQGVRMGILSDYPADAKLSALGLAGRFSPVLCATDPQIARLKPNPRGYLVACERWQLQPREVLVVGDRLDVDAAGAAAAGMSCVIVGKSSSSISRSDVRVVPSLERLRVVLNDGC
jgi:HAD superfamily hydrolase (TIGR01549 family)